MPHIFKNIRRQLASENKTAAYLRYALGKILLVVIGILIALQVNNWNEHRKNLWDTMKLMNNSTLSYSFSLLCNLQSIRN